MSLILYLPEQMNVGGPLLESIRRVVPVHEIEIFSSVGDLTERLHRPMPDVRVAVLYAASRAELMELIYLSALFCDLRVVLVLPDGAPDMLEKAYALCPRFIAAAESDFMHLSAVLKKMMEIHARSSRESYEDE